MLRKSSLLLLGTLLTASVWAALPAHAANPCAPINPCAAKNPCGANPCAANNPCAAKNPCAAQNPGAVNHPGGINACARTAKDTGGGRPSSPGAGRPRSEAVMLIGEVTGYREGYLIVRTAAGKNVRVHVVKTTLAHLGQEPVNPASIQAGARVNISTQARDGYYKANFIYAIAGGGSLPEAKPRAAGQRAPANTIGESAKTATSLSGSNPCAAKIPASGNPCAPKGNCAKNPCAPGC